MPATPGTPAGAASWIGAYFIIVTLWALIVALGSKPVLWKGRSLLIFNLVFAVATVAYLAVSDRRPGVALSVFLVFLVVIGVLQRNIWLLLRLGRVEADETLAKCLTQTRATYERMGDRYLVRTAAQDLVITLSGAAPAIGVRFAGGRGSKKAGLIRSLFGKQFRGSLPAIRVRT